ncbi:MAG: hypothetical protein R3341_04015 [Methylophaga sp.]|nr:hypothetical protein [Methylophaga sp.]
MVTKSIQLNQELIEKAAIAAKAYNRSTAKQIEHWAKIGKIMEVNPYLPYEFVKQVIVAKKRNRRREVRNIRFWFKLLKIKLI